jgi:hypothetical protein
VGEAETKSKLVAFAKESGFGLIKKGGDNNEQNVVILSAITCIVGCIAASDGNYGTTCDLLG